MWIETVGTWGDSITYGAGDEHSLGWAGRLRRELEAKHATSVYNRGVGGDTSADLLTRFAVELRSIDPGLVLIGIGTNDSVFRQGAENEHQISLEQYQENLKGLFKEAKNATQHVFAVGLTIANDPLVQPAPWSTTGKSYKTSILNEYNAAMHDVAKAADVTYIDIWELLELGDLADGLHPNAQGYQKMYEKILASITSLLS